MACKSKDLVANHSEHWEEIQLKEATASQLKTTLDHISQTNKFQFSNYSPSSMEIRASQVFRHTCSE